MKKIGISIIVCLLAICHPLLAQETIIKGNVTVGATTSGVDIVPAWGKALYLNGRPENSDPLWLSRYNAGPDSSELRVNLGDNFSFGYDKFVVGAIAWQDSLYYGVLMVETNGKVGIKTNTIGRTSALSVNGVMSGKRITVRSWGWSDYVFAPDYRLRPLREVADSIVLYKHLPGMPSAKQVTEGDLDPAQMANLQQAKIEELTLYLIQQQKQLQQMAVILEKQEQELKQTTQLEKVLDQQEKEIDVLIRLINTRLP